MTTHGSFRTRLGLRARIAIVGGFAAALIALSVAALLISSSSAARQIVDDAIILDESELALAANDVAVKALNQAVLLKEDEILAVADTATARAAAAEARQRIAALELHGRALLDVLASGTEGVDAILNATLTSASSIVAALDENDAVLAGDRLLDGLADFEYLRDVLSDIRNAARSDVEAAEGLAGRTGSLISFLIALLVPVAAILVYRHLAQQQVRVAEVELDARIEAEQEIARSKDEFIGNLSHELRTPLTTIYGFSELLLDTGLVDVDSSMELIGLINLEADELGRMVEDILAVARSEGQSLAYQFDRYDVRTEVDDYLQRIVGRDIDISVAGPPVEGWFDRVRFRQILRNLVSNADRHGGPTIRIDWQDRGSSFQLVVADNGTGVGSDEESRLFGEFFHDGDAPLTKGSLGMGLAAVKMLARGMGGNVRHERVDGWTRFVVTLPTARAVHPRVTQDPAEGKEPYLALADPASGGWATQRS